tara:strand:+ start:198 stop:893 length:696 start_codon:yes stop_codon:yes gene_type:complete
MISIICSVYNASKYLDHYLECINQQTLESFEVIFVNANSSDDSLKKIKDYKFREGISKIIIEATEKIGIYDAWNQAINHSSYDYVLNFNTDDKLFRTSLNNYYTYSKLYPNVDVIYSNCFISPTLEYKANRWYDWSDANVKESLQKGCCVGPFPLLKKSTIIAAGMFNTEFTISGDWEMWCRLSSIGKTFLKLDEFLGVYYHNPEGASTKVDQERHNRHLLEDSRIRSTYA